MIDHTRGWVRKDGTAHASPALALRCCARHIAAAISAYISSMLI